MNDRTLTSTREPLDRTTRVCILLALIGVGIASRFVLIDWPNFKPIGAIALFCGYLLSSRWQVLFALTAMLIVSDILIEFYEPPLMLSVYGSILFACLLGSKLQSMLENRSVIGKVVGVSAASLAASIFFFVSTNAMVWAIGWYPSTVSGLIHALSAGVPFFKFTLAGNLFFSLSLFCSYFALTNYRSQQETGSVRPHVPQKVQG